MKVILQENVANLGKVGEIVRVKDGYGRNYLVPNQLAVVADERNVARMEHQRRTADARAQKLVGEAKAQALEAEAKRVGLEGCALAAEWR